MKSKTKQFVFKDTHSAANFLVACEGVDGEKKWLSSRFNELVTTNLTLEDCRRAARFSGVSLPDYHIADESDQPEGS